jgi:chemotaxis signal transduction protein
LAVSEVLSLADADRDPTPVNLDRTLDATASGVFRLDEKILVTLDADRMLDFGGSRSIAAPWDGQMQKRSFELFERADGVRTI